MNIRKAAALILIVISMVGFALAIYQYYYGRGRIPTILFSIMLLLIGLSLLRKPDKPQ